MKLIHGLLISIVLAGSTAAAQTAEAPTPRPPANPSIEAIQNLLQAQAASALDTRNAQETRELLQNLFRQYPPSLSEVLRLDPSLLTNQPYLAPYPNLAVFLSQHPEVAHNPGFFLGENPFFREDRFESQESRAYRNFEQAVTGIAAFTVLLAMISLVCWIVKTVIDHRRWLRVSKIQSDVHSKLLDRFTSNQDLLAYIQTPAGRRFLESAPVSIDSSSRGMNAPVGRILLSVQGGIVLGLGGLGLFIASQTLANREVAQPLFVVAVLASALGVGFVISACVAYLMSRRLGLFDQTPLAASDSPGVSPPHA